MRKIKALFGKYDVVEGYALEEIYQASNGEITVLRYVRESGVSKGAKVNVIENGFDKIDMRLLEMSPDTFKDELTDMVNRKAKKQGIDTRKTFEDIISRLR